MQNDGWVKDSLCKIVINERFIVQSDRICVKDPSCRVICERFVAMHRCGVLMTCASMPWMLKASLSYRIQRHADLWTRHKGVRVRISIISLRKVAVVRRNNWILSTRCIVLTIPLTDTRSTRIGKNSRYKQKASESTTGTARHWKVGQRMQTFRLTDASRRTVSLETKPLTVQQFLLPCRWTGLFMVNILFCQRLRNFCPWGSAKILAWTLSSSFSEDVA